MLLITISLIIAIVLSGTPKPIRKALSDENADLKYVILLGFISAPFM
jgi:hypothetical protein